MRIGQFCGACEPMLLTILFADEWLVDNVMVVDVSIDLVVLHVDLEFVYHRDKPFLTSGGT